MVNSKVLFDHILYIIKKMDSFTNYMDILNFKFFHNATFGINPNAAIKHTKLAVGGGGSGNKIVF